MPAPRLNGVGTDSRAFAGLSLVLGAVALCAPRQVVRTIGAPQAGERVVRAVGARELASAAGLWTRPGKPGWMWSRVAGDAMDLALLATAMRARDAQRGRLGAASVAIAGIAALDLWSSIRMTRAARSRPLDEGRIE